MVTIETIPVTPLEQNCRILWSSEHNEAIVVDPGGDLMLITEKLKALNKQVVQIWLTHSHFDHVGAVADLKVLSGAKLYGHKSEEQFRKSVPSIAAGYGLDGFKECPEPDVYLKGGEVLEFGGVKWEVFFTPGHSPGHLAFYSQDLSVILSGDVIFNGSVGRTDLPGASQATLMSSIANCIMKLPDNVKVLSGHGPDTTVGQERANNPFRPLFLRAI